MADLNLSPEETAVLEVIVRESVAATVGHKSFAGVLKIANLSMEVHELERLARIERRDLSTAYSDHKSRTGHHTGIKRGSPEWDEMMEATTAEYAAVKDAQRKVSNAKRRLRIAINRYLVAVVEDRRAAA